MSEDKQPRLIDFYNRGEWSRTVDPLSDFIDFEKAVKEAGFEMFEHFGTEGSTSLEIYRQYDSGRWLICMNSFGYWQPFLVADLGSLLMLMPTLESWTNMVHESHKMELIEEAADLLFGYNRTAGPLAEALYERRQQRQREKEREEARARRTVGKTG